MIPGELRTKIDAGWIDFWSGGISNPMEVIEQLTYLLFIKGLDERQTLLENKANRTGEPIEDPIFPEGEVFTPKGWRWVDRTPTSVGRISGPWAAPRLCTHGPPADDARSVDEKAHWIRS